jgi:hypothetical protein
MEKEACVECGKSARLRGRDYESLCDEHYIARNHFIVVHDIIGADGKTYQETNLERQHRIPIGTLVEVKYDKWHGDGACEKVHARLWVIHHGRDCDGTPLYALSKYRDAEPFDPSNRNLYAPRVRVNGMPEESLTPIEVTADLAYGHGALEWPDDDAVVES